MPQRVEYGSQRQRTSFVGRLFYKREMVMVNDYQKQTDNWNAEDYARNSSAQELWANELISKLSLKGNESLLDIGCGNGRITNEIARRLPFGYVIGIDSSESMIELSSKSITNNNLSFYVMSATDIHLDKKFDIAFSNATLHWVKEHPAVLASLKKHLNPNAKILFQMGGKGNALEIVSTLEQVTTLSKWSEYFKGFDFPYHFYGVEDYERWLPVAGYKASRIELIPKDMVHKNPDGLKGWLRTTWFPYTNRLPNNQREIFLAELIGKYIEKKPVDSNGQTHVNMVRLEVEARAL
jgi:trans-aconitate methyltransferase